MLRPDSMKPCRKRPLWEIQNSVWRGLWPSWAKANSGLSPDRSGAHRQCHPYREARTDWTYTRLEVRHRVPVGARSSRGPPLRKLTARARLGRDFSFPNHPSCGLRLSILRAAGSPALGLDFAGLRGAALGREKASAYSSYRAAARRMISHRQDVARASELVPRQATPV